MKGYGRPTQQGVSEKWLALNQVIKEHRLALLAIQEAHITEERLHALNTLFESQLRIIGSPDPRNQTGACGVAFAVSKRHLRERNVSVEILIPGRAILAVLPWSQERTIKILNVYAPNDARDNASFWDDLRRILISKPNLKPDVTLGDFNVVEGAMDRLPTREDPEAATTALGAMLNDLEQIDTWRRAHPHELQYTFLQRTPISQSRLDRIYVKRGLQPVIADWQCEPPGISTDHNLVSCSIANYHSPKVGKGRWAIPLWLLSDKDFAEKMKTLGGKLAEEMGTISERTKENNPQVLWNDFKKNLPQSLTNKSRRSRRDCNKQWTQYSDRETKK
ncbi:DNase I-like protein [Trametes cingulata]|nr:DNase I-like protein [Trametes cingulata]